MKDDTLRAEPLPALDLEDRKVVVVGLGGIGSWLVRVLAPYLSAQDIDSLLLVDGDVFEKKNESRMVFDGDGGNKAECMEREIMAKHESLVTYSVPSYVTEENIGDLIEDTDVVFLCVDNHATRKLVGEHCSTLENVVLISGGNDGVEGELRGNLGNVIVHYREDGEDLTPPLTKYHPEIANPQDEPPGTASCTELMNSAPQIVFTNNMAASAMTMVFYSLVSGECRYHESYFDVFSGKAVPLWFGGA